MTKVTMSLLALLLLLSLNKTSEATPLQNDIRFILQTQGGLTAYTDLETAVSLPHARQLLSTIEVETESFVYGVYNLQGSTDWVKLAIGKDGWLIAFHPPEYGSEYLIGCPTINRPERAVLETAAALGYPDPVVGFYDARYPEATAVALHWLYTAQSDTLTSTVYLPLENIYLERGYAFCTALTNSKFYLNEQMIEQAGAVSQVQKRWGTLAASQLRAGQTNTMKISTLSVFGSGFFAGVSTVYTGDAPITTTDGYSRTLTLDYPGMIGEPLEISRVYLPVVSR